MKKLITFTVIFAILILTACSNSSKTLQQKLEVYKKAYKAKDYITMASMVLPSVIEETGGTQGFVDIMQMATRSLEEQGIEPTKISFGKTGKIVSHEDSLISVIPTTTPVNIQGRDGFIKGSVIAFSDDKGKTWFFLEGTDESRAMIADSVPEILQKITVPTPTVELGSGKDRLVLVQQSGQWVEK